MGLRGSRVRGTQHPVVGRKPLPDDVGAMETDIVPNFNVLWEVISNLTLSGSGMRSLQRVSKKVTRRSVLYGPNNGNMRQHTILRDSSTYSYVPTRWPGTSTVALQPMIFRPRLLCFVRLNPASSTEMKLCVGSLASSSIARYIQKTQNQFYELHAFSFWTRYSYIKCIQHILHLLFYSHSKCVKVTLTVLYITIRCCTVYCEVKLLHAHTC